MTESYVQLKELAVLYRGTENVQEIALNYQDTEDAILLSYVFCKNLGITSQVSSMFFGLTESDITSFALEEMHKAMMNYREDGGAKISTLYSKFLRNRLRAETQAINYDKRAANNGAHSLEGMQTEDEKGNKSDTGKYKDTGYLETAFEEIEILQALATNPDITQNEYKYCEIILTEVANVKSINNSEIASRLNITSAGLHYLKKSLQKKLGMGTNIFAINI